jgi:hypothetical protein
VGGSLDVEPLADELDELFTTELLADESPARGVGVHGNWPGVTGNWRSTDPAQRLGPSAPQPEIGFSVFQSGVYDHSWV